jgi:hypothetical protein
MVDHKDYVLGYRAPQSLHSGNLGNWITFPGWSQYASFASSVRYRVHPDLGVSISIEPTAWLARDFGTDPATGLNGVTVAIIGRTRLSADGDAAAVRAVLDLATDGSAWRALQLQDPISVTSLTAMQNAAAALRPVTAPDILVSAVLNQVCLAMFPGGRASTGRPPVVAEGSYLSQWWQTHVGRRR